MRQQLKDRLSPYCPGLRPEELEDIISECTHVFGGMQTHAQERGALKELLREYIIEPRRRLLGMRAVQSVDAEGVSFGPVREKPDYCWDLPAEETIQRLLHRVPRALHEILAHARAMDMRAQIAEDEGRSAYMQTFMMAIYIGSTRGWETRRAKRTRALRLVQWFHLAWNCQQVATMTTLSPLDHWGLLA